MSKVISFRVKEEIYNYFKSLDKPFSVSIPPLLLDYKNKMKTKACIHDVYSSEKSSEYEDIDDKIDLILKRLNK